MIIGEGLNGPSRRYARRLGLDDCGASGLDTCQSGQKLRAALRRNRITTIINYGCFYSMTFWLALLAVFSASLMLTGALRRNAAMHNLMDVPNERSSHSLPTPRNGGIAITLCFLAALPVSGLSGLMSWTLVWALLGSGAGIAILGFLDDHGHIAVRWRLLGHFSAAAWVLVLFGGLPPLSVAGVVLHLGWLGHVLAAFYLVWVLNLYNFMDGIDGIAGIEAITVSLGVCLVYWLSGNEQLIWTPLLLSMSVLGFLYWNFPPAKIFMGDTGSGFLGLVVGVLSIQAAWRSSELFWGWLILLGVFIVDATFTLIRRFFQRERIYQAHRSHAYQFASRQLESHTKVTVSVALINILWLLPVALCVALQIVDGLTGLVLAYVPLVMLALRFNAGKPEEKIILVPEKS